MAEKSRNRSSGTFFHDDIATFLPLDDGIATFVPHVMTVSRHLCQIGRESRTRTTISRHFCHLKPSQPGRQLYCLVAERAPRRAPRAGEPGGLSDPEGPPAREAGTKQLLNQGVRCVARRLRRRTRRPRWSGSAARSRSKHKTAGSPQRVRRLPPYILRITYRLRPFSFAS